ncbi:SDR family oxidoreductase [Flavobacterium sp. TSSA_36]|uniref:SDR family oxidoreductase n=1 Tax=Flavobacterium sp. TSSA_36 TaxID=3447669 RepID=UPI003F353190
MTQISILGCGWLGLPLAKDLVKNGLLVKGSTTSSSKLAHIEKLGVLPFLMELQPNAIDGDITTFLMGSEILIIDIPPKLRSNNSEDFVGKMQTLIPFIEQSDVQNVLFVSSTSVYGEANDVVTETTPLNPDSEGGRQLVLVEQLLQSNPHFQTTILRFGGLVGPDRNPVRFLAGKENLPNAKAPINFIHQADCIGIIQKIIGLNCWNETFNAVSPYHPSREEYYTKKAIEWQLVAPTFDRTLAGRGKRISSDKLQTILKYIFAEIP